MVVGSFSLPLQVGGGGGGGGPTPRGRALKKVNWIGLSEVAVFSWKYMATANRVVHSGEFLASPGAERDTV